jgi:hypothetical protein
MTLIAVQSKLLVVFDTQIPDLHILMAGLVEAADLLVLDPNQDGIAQITQFLIAQPVTALHIVSHGQPGLLQLGQTQITSANLSDYAGLLRLWASTEILLYGCEVGQGETGRNFIAQLSELTGARIAASETATGNAALGGHWNLSATTGQIESGLAFRATALNTYRGILAPSNNNPVVTPSVVTPSYSENGAAILLDTAVTVTDSDSTNFDTGSLTLRFTSGGIMSDRLSILPGGSVTLDGKTVKVGGTAIGTYAGGIGTEDLVVSFNASATPTTVQTLLQAIGYANTAEDLSSGSRTVAITLTDGDGGTSTAVNKTITVTGVNDAPIIGQTTQLYDASLNTKPDAQGWIGVVPTGATASASNGSTQLDTLFNSALYAGYSTVSGQPLDAAQGFVINFSAEILDEATETTANKNGDGKSDRAGFSIIVVSSDKTKAIELGFNKVGSQLSIFAQEDGTSQADPTQAPNNSSGSPLTLFTQAESALFTPSTGLNTYDLAVSGTTYTIYANGTAILSGRLRDYTAFTPTAPIPDPYETPNLIFFGDDTTSAKANINLGSVNVTTHSSLPAQTVNEDEAVAISNLYVSDWDGSDSLTVTVSVTQGNLTLASSGGAVVTNSGSSTVTLTGSQAQINQTLSQGNLNYQGNSNFNGTDSLTISASDGVVASPVTQSMSITVNAVNDAPTASDGTVSTDEDTAYVLTTTDFSFSDLDSTDSLQSVKIIQIPSAGSLTLDGSPVNADDEILVADILAGKLQFMPVANANGSSYSSFQFQVSDGTEFSPTQTLTVNVKPVNDAPEISGIPDFSVRQDDTYIFAPDFADIDGDDLSFTIENQPTWAEFDSQTGMISGRPTNDDVGITQNILISVSDGQETVELAQFDLTVENVNDLPVISGQPNTTVAEDGFYSFTPLANDPDVGDQLNFSITNKPTWASFDPSTGTLSGTPTNENVGTTQAIVISVSDGQETVELPAFSLTVTNTNDAPILTSPIADAIAKAGKTFSVTVNNFQDPDLGDNVSLSATLDQGQPLPTWLTFDPATRSFSGTPASTDVGQLTLNVTATDSSGLQISDLLNLTVEAAPPTGISTAPIQMTRSNSTRQQGTAQADLLKGGLVTNDLILGRNGNDVIIGGIGQAKAGSDRLYGENGNDRLYGGNGTDLLDGGSGNDKAWGGKGRDQLVGSSGNDRLWGQEGDDILTGGAGKDLLSGGQGKDMFVFTRLDEGIDSITDFDGNEDMLDLRQIFTAPEFSGITNFNRVQQFIQIEQLDTNSIAIKLDADGKGSGSSFTTLAILQNSQISQIGAKNFVIV